MISANHATMSDASLTRGRWSSRGLAKAVDPQIRSDQSATGGKWFIFLLAATSLGLASYLSWVALTSAQLAGCGSGQVLDCNHVMQTKWSSVFGVPVGVPAALLHLSILVGVATSLTAGGARVREIASTVVVFGAMTAAVAALWFISLQLFVVGHLCGYCLAVHGCGLLLAAAVFLTSPLSNRKLRQLTLLSFIGVAALATVQVMADPPQTFELESHSRPTEPRSESTATNAPAAPALNESEVFSAPGFAPPAESDGDLPNKNSAEPRIFEAPIGIDRAGGRPQRQRVRKTLYAAGIRTAAIYASNQQELVQQVPAAVASKPAKQDEESESRRLVSIAGGKIQLDVDQWPLVGSKKADLIFVEMFDYTCPHCRANHQSVESALQQLNGQVALIALSTPLNRDCNNTVKMTNAQHADACKLARLSVAVWRVDASKFPVFHDWLFTGKSAPTIAVATKEAERLVGGKRLHAELGRDVVGKYVAKQVELYKTLGAGTVPKLLFTNTTLSGKVANAETLVRIIKQQSNDRGLSPARRKSY